jgi:hypothetical protein
MQETGWGVRLWCLAAGCQTDECRASPMSGWMVALFADRTSAGRWIQGGCATLGTKAGCWRDVGMSPQPRQSLSASCSLDMLCLLPGHCKALRHTRGFARP